MGDRMMGPRGMMPGDRMMGPMGPGGPMMGPGNKETYHFFNFTQVKYL